MSIKVLRNQNLSLNSLKAVSLLAFKCWLESGTVTVGCGTKHALKSYPYSKRKEMLLAVRAYTVCCGTILPFNRSRTTRECVNFVILVRPIFAPVTLTLTCLTLIYKLDLGVLEMYLRVK